MLAQAMGSLSDGPKVLISASAVGYYVLTKARGKGVASLPESVVTGKKQVDRLSVLA